MKSYFAGAPKWLIPLVSFAGGWLSYWLVERSEALSRVIAATVLLGWLWILAQEFLGGWLDRRTPARFKPQAVLGYVTQAIHQETLFFALPFLWASTQWDSGQGLFTALVAVAALVSTLDVIYLRRIAPRPFLSLAFHGLCTFVAALVILPVAARLSLEVTLEIAFGLAAVAILPGVLRWLAHRPRTRIPLRLAVLALAVPLAWWLRTEVPPAAVQLREGFMTFGKPPAPAGRVEQLSARDLHRGGLTAFAAIRAPAGLSQKVNFEWRWRGELVDLTPSTIQGGREAGYRTWSRKHAFPDDARGDWSVDLRTGDGQLIGRIRFRVV